MTIKEAIDNAVQNGDSYALQVILDSWERDLYVDPNGSVEHPPVAISFGSHTINGVEYPTPVATYGNLIVIQAPPKSMKTFFTSLLISAFIEGGNARGFGNLKGHSNNKDVYHFDTEQSKFHAQRVFSRINKMAKEPSSGYNTYALRALDHAERKHFIEYCLFEKSDRNVGMFVIDGIADLVADVNNIEESNKLVQDVMRWTQELNCVGICVIHQNYGSDKPTGHLGSALQKKAESMIRVERDGLAAKISAKDTRNFPFEEFVMKINGYGYPEIIPNVMSRV